MKYDPWKNKEKYENWKKKGYIVGVSKNNSNLLVEYLVDMERGYNVTRPGARSFSRLNNLRQRMS